MYDIPLEDATTRKIYKVKWGKSCHVIALEANVLFWRIHFEYLDADTSVWHLTNYDKCSPFKVTSQTNPILFRILR